MSETANPHYKLVETDTERNDSVIKFSMVPIELMLIYVAFCLCPEHRTVNKVNVVCTQTIITYQWINANAIH